MDGQLTVNRGGKIKLHQTVNIIKLANVIPKIEFKRDITTYAVILIFFGVLILSPNVASAANVPTDVSSSNTTNLPSSADQVSSINVPSSSGRSLSESRSEGAPNASASAKPQCLLVFDDGFAAQYSIAFKYMQTQGIVGTAYVNGYNIGQPGVITLSNLKEMNSAGWIIASHSYDHVNLTSLTNQQISDELSTNINFLISNGLPDGAYDLAYPFGQYNQNVLDVMNQLGIKTGRTTNLALINNLDGLNIYQLPVFGASTTNVTCSVINYAITNNSTVIIVFHNIVSTDPTAGTTFTDFTNIIDYIVSSGIDCLTINDLYNESLLVNAPTVTSTTPVNNSTDVSLASPITITFKNDVAAGPNFSSISIKNLITGSLVQLTSTSINGNILSITPAIDRLYNTTYQVYIPAGAVRDNSGYNLASAYQVNFTTLMDTFPPIINSTNPVDGSSAVPLNTSPVTVTFNENVLAGPHYSGIYIKNLSSGLTVSIASKSLSGSTLTIIQTYNRLANCIYQVYIPASAIKDLCGNALNATNAFKYSTYFGAGSNDTKPPTVTGTNPTVNASGIQLASSPVTITFSESVVSGSNYSGIYIKNVTTGKTISLSSVSINGSTLTIKSTHDRLANCVYQVYIPAGAVKDASGNNLASSYQYTFSTVTK